MHLLIDGYGGDAQRMEDRELLYRFLNEFPNSLSMNKICQPSILRYDAPKPEDSGLSGFVIIAESHISVHTFPRRNYINIDIFSCKAFDSEQALKDIQEFFLLQQVKTWVIDRGLEHYDPSLAARALAQEQVPGVGDS